MEDESEEEELNNDDLREKKVNFKTTNDEDEDML
jgi:hypothetical protein